MKEQNSTNNNVFYINSEFCAPEALLHLLTGKSVTSPLKSNWLSDSYFIRYFKR